MANNPRIIFDSNNLDFPKKIADYRITHKQEQKKNTSANGTIEFINSFDKFFIEIALKRFDNDFMRDLQAFISYAGKGNVYAFAFDRDKTVNTTLDGTASAGQKVIPLTSTTDCAVGDRYRIRNSDSEFELVEIASISAGVSVTAVDNLIYSYESGDSFVYEDYWPEVISEDNSFKPELLRGSTSYNWKHRMREK